MPVYTVYFQKDRVSQETKGGIARAITRIHNELTGTHSFLAQVIFLEVASENFFIGGNPLSVDNIFVHGLTRSGRSPECKRELTDRIVEAVADVMLTERRHVWTYIDERPAGQMAEYGRILPEPGSEAAWVEALPPDDRAFMESMAG